MAGKNEVMTYADVCTKSTCFYHTFSNSRHSHSFGASVAVHDHEILWGKTAIPSTDDVICDINSTSHRILHTPVRYTDWSCCCGFRTTGMGVQRFCRHYSRRQWTLICIEYASRRCAVKSNFLKLAESSPPMTKPKQNRLQHQQQDKKHEVTGFRHWFCWAEKKIY